MSDEDGCVDPVMAVSFVTYRFKSSKRAGIWWGLAPRMVELEIRQTGPQHYLAPAPGLAYGKGYLLLLLLLLLLFFVVLKFNKWMNFMHRGRPNLCS